MSRLYARVRNIIETEVQAIETRQKDGELGLEDIRKLDLIVKIERLTEEQPVDPTEQLDPEQLIQALHEDQ